MLKPSINEVLDKIDNRYYLVGTVAKRAREITAEQEESGEVTDDKPVLIAIDEIKNHEIGILEPDDDELPNS